MSRRASRAAVINPAQLYPPVDYSITRLGASGAGGQTFPGGLDQVTPSLSLQPGALKSAVNFEVGVNGGYGRIVGYERYDGRPAPSDASYQIIQIDGDDFTNTPSVGDVIAQSGSGASATVASVSDPAAGDIPYMLVTKISGVFDDIGTITVGATTIGETVAVTVFLTSKQQAQGLAAAADVYRADIQKVPGSGSILGVACMDLSGIDSVFAWRANAGGTAVAVYKKSSSGWVLVPFYDLVEFTAGGTSEPSTGETLTQGGVTATVKRVMTRTGDWLGSNAAGGLVITVPAGGSFAAGAATLSGGASVTLSGAESAITMAVGGRVEIAKGNFSGQFTTNKMYGCDGINKAFEFDGDTLAPITTGLSNDQPNHVAFHKGYLFLSFGSSAFYSGPGTPFRWTAVDGSGEIAVGDTITGMITMPGNQNTATLAIFQHTKTSFVYGNAASTWQLVDYNTGIGARNYSVQNLFDCFSFDDFGVATQQARLEFGNFSTSALTRNILPFIVSKRSSVVSSTLNRTKGQYRVFFRDGYGLYLSVSNQTYLGAVPVLFPDPVLVVDNDKTAAGDEVTYFGSTDGYVYQLDKGKSFDDQDLYAYFATAWDPLKTPRLLKRMRACSVEISSTEYAEFQFGYQLGYDTALINQPPTLSSPVSFTGAPSWDTFTWDNFTWDGVSLEPTDLDMNGTEVNIQVMIQSSGNYIAPFQVNSVIYHYTLRRGKRV